MQFVVALLKKLPIFPIVLFFGGIGIGLLIGWVIAPVEYTDTTPDALRADLQVDYLRMAIDSFRLNQNQDLAIQRWQNLGSGAAPAYTEIQNNPKGTDPAVILAYGQLVESWADANGTPPATEGAATGSPLTRMIVIGVGIFLLGLVLVAAFIFYRRIFGTRGSGEVTAVMQAAEISRNAEK